MDSKTPSEILAEYRQYYADHPDDELLVPQLYISLLQCSYRFEDYNKLRGMIFVRCAPGAGGLYEFGLALCLDWCRRGQQTYYFISPIGRPVIENEFSNLFPKKYRKLFHIREYDDFEDLLRQLIDLFEKHPRTKINALVDSINWLQILDDRHDSALSLALLAEQIASRERRRIFALGDAAEIGRPPAGTGVIDYPSGEISLL